MAIFQSSPSKKDPPPAPTPEPARPAPPQQQANTDFSPATFPRTDAVPAAKESVIAADLTIEGKIEGAGNVRIAGRFKGDVNVQGDLTLERGAKLKGVIRAKKVVMAGELEGNIEAAARVELLESAALIGDIKAGTLTVAAGCKIRGHIDCGWENAAPKTAAPKVEPPAE